jgi:hypothetical protein
MNTASCSSGICYREILDWFPTSRRLNIRLNQSSGDLKNECGSSPFTQYAFVAVIGTNLYLLFSQLPLLFILGRYISALKVDGRMTDGGSERMWQQIVIF